MFIPEQFRELVKDIYKFEKQTEEITLATYAKQLYLENLYTAQGKNILCDRSVLDTFVYYNYFKHGYTKFPILNGWSLWQENSRTYSKIYLIEPSDREIENDGFRLTDKKQQLEVHKLFLECFKNLDNVEIVNQEDAHKEEFVDKVVSEFVL
jgi:thymidylate kinase